MNRRPPLGALLGHGMLGTRELTEEEKAEHQAYLDRMEAERRHEALVLRWRHYAQVAVSAQAVTGIDAKIASKVADELCAAEDFRFSGATVSPLRPVESKV